MCMLTPADCHGQPDVCSSTTVRAYALKPQHIQADLCLLAGQGLLHCLMPLLQLIILLLQ